MRVNILEKYQRDDLLTYIDNNNILCCKLLNTNKEYMSDIDLEFMDEFFGLIPNSNYIYFILKETFYEFEGVKSVMCVEAVYETVKVPDLEVIRQILN